MWYKALEIDIVLGANSMLNLTSFSSVNPIKLPKNTYETQIL